MALTEEQLEEIAISVSQRVSCALNFEDAIELVRGVIAALPKPDRPSHWEKNDTGEVIPAFGEDCPWGHSPLYRIHTIAPPASDRRPGLR